MYRCQGQTIFIRYKSVLTNGLADLIGRTTCMRLVSGLTLELADFRHKTLRVFVLKVCLQISGAKLHVPGICTHLSLS